MLLLDMEGKSVQQHGCIRTQHNAFYEEQLALASELMRMYSQSAEYDGGIVPPDQA